MDRDRRGGVATFYVLACAFSWLLWVPLGLSGPSERDLPYVIAAFGSFGPSLAAISVEWRAGGLPAVRRLLRPLAYWRVSPTWYVVALLATAALFTLSIVALRLLADPPHPLIRSIDVRSLPGESLAVLMLGGPLGEEIGWRGWALPRLAERRGPLAASLAVGVLWRSGTHRSSFCRADSPTRRLRRPSPSSSSRIPFCSGGCGSARAAAWSSRCCTTRRST